MNTLDNKHTEENQQDDVRQTGGLTERLKRVKTTRWIRFGVVSVIFFAWVYWLGNWWVAPWWLLLADIYLTQFIPWNWWKYSNNKTVRGIMSWVDAIVYALVLVYFLFAFVGQNYQIPSSSLEKTLLTGDFLWVNKMVYGPRVPQTPLHFPLAQNTLPVLNCKSYIEKPQFAYHRLKGWRGVERGDIVVFNFPCGDTVMTLCPNPDYYSLVHEYGEQALLSNPERFGERIWRPVDRRDAYVKRCLGLPGETLTIKNGVVSINGKELPQPKNVQFFYFVSTKNELADETFDELGIAIEDRHPIKEQIPGSTATAFSGYALPLTATMVKRLKANPQVNYVRRMPVNPDEGDIVFPIGHDMGWTHADFGPLWIPKKGETINLTLKNLPLYERCIRTYEGNRLEVKNGIIYINDIASATYTFKMDYYWMMGDNRDNSLDSRYWGFVPEDHIIGTPMFVIVSFDKDKRLFSGGIRWNRVFIDANPDK